VRAPRDGIAHGRHLAAEMVEVKPKDGHGMYSVWFTACGCDMKKVLV
jgi:hypothetical protein